MSDNVDNIQDITMDQVMASMDNEQEIRQGKVVEGTIVSIDKEGIMVDIGGKSEAKIPLDQLSAKDAENIEENFKVGEKIKARVLQPSSKEGIILSKKSIDYELGWDEIQKLYESQQIVTAMVKEANFGGLRIDLRSYPAFCPNSQVWGKPEKKTIINKDGKEEERSIYESLVGETLEFEIKEIDKDKHKIILSNKDVIKKQRDKAKKEFWAGIYEGQTRKGVVKSLTSYGAFINLGFFDGMLHISEMSWHKIASPKDILNVGDEIDVYVKSADEKAKKISLSLKEILPDPWNDIPAKYPEGFVFEGKITRVAQKAAFVDLGNGEEGIIPISEMSIERIDTPKDKVNVGDMVTVKVKQLSEDDRKVTLSMKALEAEKIDQEEQAAYEEYQKEQEASSSFNIGEQFADELKNAVEN